MENLGDQLIHPPTPEQQLPKLYLREYYLKSWMFLKPSEYLPLPPTT